MEALLYLGGVVPSESGVAAQLRAVLGMEYHHWAKVVEKNVILSGRELQRAVAQITLLQGAPTRAFAEDTFMGDGHYSGRESRVRMSMV